MIKPWVKKELMSLLVRLPVNLITSVFVLVVVLALGALAVVVAGVGLLVASVKVAADDKFIWESTSI